MDKRDQFEQKIKDKLEQVSIPEQGDAWEQFVPMLSNPKPSFWNHKSMTYLFASTLFLLSLLWHQREENIETNQTPLQPSITAIDTIYRVDTIYQIDTVYLIKKIYISELQEIVGSADSLERKPQILSMNESDLALQEHRKGKTEDKERSSGEQSKTNQPVSSETSIAEKKKVKSENLSQVTSSTDSVLHDSPSHAYTAPIRRSMAAPSVGPKEKVILKSDKIQVVGDTSNLSQPSSIATKKKPFLNVELASSVMFPISSFIEYYTPFQFGGAVGLEWESGWGIYTGVIRNQVEGELDDEEIMRLSSRTIAALPSLPPDLNSIDEIYLTNRQMYFPVELRWRSLYYNGISFESSFGLVANYLQRQEFIYEFENNSIEEFRFEKAQLNQFNLSHLRVGIGTNYLFSKRMGLFLRSHYWLPISRPGLLEDRMQGIEVGAGLNFFLSK